MDFYVNLPDAIGDFEKSGLPPDWMNNNFPHLLIMGYLYALGHHMGDTDTINGPLTDSEIEIAIGLFRAGILDGQMHRRTFGRA
jgi:hypothetical protein